MHEIELQFTVSDTGIGISPEKQQTIFHAFQQADTSTTKRYGGTGLGLTIAAQLVALMGGQIKVESRPGKGSTFSFVTRFKQLGCSLDVVDSPQEFDRLRVAEHLVEVSSGVSAPLRILVAEDNEFNSDLLNQLLTRRGHKARIVGNGSEALAEVKKEDFDLLLLDLHMPELDGFQVVEAIRHGERDSGNYLPIIALTARSAKEDRDKCLAAGMDEFLVKPIHADSLWDTIDRVVATHSRGTRSTPDLLNPATILAACGDDETILKAICQTFQTQMPIQLGQVQAALNDGNCKQLCEAAHKFSATLAAFSTVAGSMVSNLEDQAAADQLEVCRPLVSQLAVMSESIVRQINDLSIGWLRSQVSKQNLKSPSKNANSEEAMSKASSHG